MYYLWRLCESEKWMVLDSLKYPPEESGELYQFHAEAKAEADKRNRVRPNEAQGELGI